MRETGIFTGTTSSLCPSLRQLSDRYAIRAGRNLPDKEFRYLRTVQFVTHPLDGPGRFRQTLHIAVQFGLYHHDRLTVLGV